MRELFPQSNTNASEKLNVTSWSVPGRLCRKEAKRMTQLKQSRVAKRPELWEYFPQSISAIAQIKSISNAHKALNMPETPKNAGAGSEKLLDAALRLFAPLVRLLIARGVTFQVASELLKRAYVRAATNHFVEGEETTGTRLSLLTGLNRKEIKRLTEESEEPKSFPMASYAGAVYGVWQTQRRWRDADGKPRVLPRRSVGGQVSFDELVRSVTTDHRPAAVLEEMLRLGFVSIEENNDLRLSDAPVIPRQQFDDQIGLLTESVEDHMRAAVTNVLEAKPKYLERMLFSDELSAESAEKLHDKAREHWNRIQDDIVENAISAEQKDRETGAVAKTRIRVGMYFYSETENNE
jgi:Family of unknown function (DUF6502)